MPLGEIILDRFCFTVSTVKCVQFSKRRFLLRQGKITNGILCVFLWDFSAASVKRFLGKPKMV